MNNLNTRNRLI